MRDWHPGRRPLAADLVEELELPAPFLSVVGVPPALQNSRFAAGEQYDPADVGRCRPTILQRDRCSVPQQEAHRPRLMAFQAIASGNDLSGCIGDNDLESLRRGMDQDAIAGVIRVDPRAGEGQARCAGARKPEVPGFKPTGHEEVVILLGSRRNDTRDNSRASLQEARRSRLEAY